MRVFGSFTTRLLIEGLWGLKWFKRATVGGSMISSHGFQSCLKPMNFPKPRKAVGHTSSEGISWNLQWLWLQVLVVTEVSSGVSSAVIYKILDPDPIRSCEVHVCSVSRRAHV